MDKRNRRKEKQKCEDDAFHGSGTRDDAKDSILLMPANPKRVNGQTKRVNCMTGAIECEDCFSDVDLLMLFDTPNLNPTLVWVQHIANKYVLR